MKRIPERTCMGCNEKKTKNDLLRIVKDKEDNIEVDLTGKKNGRGAYICKNESCLDKLIRSKRLNKVFEIEISNEVYDDIRKVIIDINKL